MTTVGLVWAQAHDGVIGADGGMPWHVPEDLAHFRAVTGSSDVVMGRRTWESLPPRFRPLPGRRNIVVTRSAEWSADGAERAASLDQALALADGDDVWVIGGGRPRGRRRHLRPRGRRVASRGHRWLAHVVERHPIPLRDVPATGALTWRSR